MKLTRACLDDLQAYLEMEQMDSGYRVGHSVALFDRNMAYLLQVRQEFRDTYGMTIEQAEEAVRQYARQSAAKLPR